MESLGFKLKKCRNEAKMSQQQLADKLNVIRQTVSHWENGVRKPDAEMLKDLAELFNVTTDYLLGTQDIKPPLTQSHLDDTYDRIKDTFGEEANVLFHDISSFDDEEFYKLKMMVDLIKNQKK